MKASVFALALGVAAIGAEPIPMPGPKETLRPPSNAGSMDVSLGVAGYAEGEVFYFYFGQLVGRTPVWEEGEEHPPLSPRRAKEIASRELAKLLHAPEKWSRSEISLRESPFKGRWYYIVAFRNPDDPNSSSGMRVVVLMDGTVPDAKRADYPTDKPNK